MTAPCTWIVAEGKRF